MSCLVRYGGNEFRPVGNRDFTTFVIAAKQKTKK